MKLFNEYQSLLAKRESKEVLGKKWANTWLLAAVLTATFLSIAFSNGSMEYLSDKMNDPFTNWVDINQEFRSGRFENFRSELQSQEVKNHYLFDNVQSDHYTSLMFAGQHGTQPYLKVRFFQELDGNIVEAILSPENVINDIRCDANALEHTRAGVIVTQDVIKKMKYSMDSIPAYIDYLSYSPGADTLGVEVDADGFAKAPIPLLGVVKRLPGNMDVIASQEFLRMRNDDMKYPFHMNSLEYQRTLHFFLPEEVTDEDFHSVVAQVVPDSLATSFSILDDEKEDLLTWKPGRQVSIFFNDYNLPVEVYQSTARSINRELGSAGVKRLFDYELSGNELPPSEYISVIFNSLDSIRAFEKFAKDNYSVQIEMAQVTAKENFNAVSVMANILSWVMIVFSMACIIMFIVNMLQSYFQKVKRNLGTFKAFGMSSTELIRVYVIILLAIVGAAIAVGLLTSWIVQLLLPLFGVLKDGEYNYLSLWNVKTYVAAAVMLCATVVTVWGVMRRLLRQTPGDLIYDRN